MERLTDVATVTLYSDWQRVVMLLTGLTQSLWPIRREYFPHQVLTQYLMLQNTYCLKDFCLILHMKSLLWKGNRGEIKKTHFHLSEHCPPITANQESVGTIKSIFWIVKSNLTSFLHYLSYILWGQSTDVFNPDSNLKGYYFMLDVVQFYQLNMSSTVTAIFNDYCIYTSVVPLDRQRRSVPFQGLRPPKHMYLTSRYSSMPYLEPSRPKPDCLTPPNVASGVDRRPSLTPTIPTSNSSATRHIWLTSCE